MLLFIVSVATLFVVVVGFHEFGHYFIAKRVGIGVTEYALGFGPKIISKEWHGTRYSLRLIPAGGFARLAGMIPGDGTDDAHAFYLAAPWKRALTLAGGVVCNFFLAGVLFAIALMLPLPSTLEQGEPAYAAGLRDGATITAIDGTAIDTSSATKGSEQLVRAISGSHGAQLSVNYTDSSGRHHSVKFYPALLLVNGQHTATDTLPKGALVITTVNGVSHPQGNPGALISAAPVVSGYELTQGLTKGASFSGHDPTVTSASGLALGNSQAAWKVGIASSVPGESVLAAVPQGFQDVGLTLQNTVVGIWKLATQPKYGGITGPNGLQGPVGIATATDQAAQTGLADYLLIMALVSTSVGLINVLPIPFLDGGRLIFVIIEVVRRNKVNPMSEAVVHAIGLLALVVFAVYVTVHEVGALIK